MISVSVVDVNDRATWAIQFDPSATAAQRAQAETLRLTYDADTDSATKDERAAREYDAEKLLQAVAVALWECIPAPTMTKAQMKTRAIAVYKTLI